jgi:hypothetical protein
MVVLDQLSHPQNYYSSCRIALIGRRRFCLSITKEREHISPVNMIARLHLDASSLQMGIRGSGEKYKAKFVSLAEVTQNTSIRDNQGND